MKFSLYEELDTTFLKRKDYRSLHFPLKLWPYQCGFYVNPLIHKGMTKVSNEEKKHYKLLN